MLDNVQTKNLLILYIKLCAKTKRTEQELALLDAIINEINLRREYIRNDQ